MNCGDSSVSKTFGPFNNANMALPLPRGSRIIDAERNFPRLGNYVGFVRTEKMLRGVEGFFLNTI